MPPTASGGVRRGVAARPARGVPSVAAMERRRFLLTLAAGLAGVAAVHGAAGLAEAGDAPVARTAPPAQRLDSARPAAATERGVARRPRRSGRAPAGRGEPAARARAAPWR